MLAGQPQDKLGSDQALLQPEQLIQWATRVCDRDLR